jgi:hypothetical protein
MLVYGQWLVGWGGIFGDYSADQVMTQRDIDDRNSDDVVL